MTINTRIEMTYEYLCVLDFEAVFQENPDDEKNYHMEIIEFPSVLYRLVTVATTALNRSNNRNRNSNRATTTIVHELEKVDEFQRYVRTRRIPTLNDYCIQQTGITQHMVDNGVPFDQVVREHTEWLRSHLNGSEPSEHNVLMVTCGDWDLKTMLPHQLKFETTSETDDADITIGSHLRQWCNVKYVYERFYRKQQKKAKGMLGMLNGLGMQLEGRHHSGIDDCRNIGRIVNEMVKQGCEFAPTGKHDATSGKVRWLRYDPTVAQ